MSSVLVLALWYGGYHTGLLILRQNLDLASSPPSNNLFYRKPRHQKDTKTPVWIHKYLFLKWSWSLICRSIIWKCAHLWMRLFIHKHSFLYFSWLIGGKAYWFSKKREVGDRGLPIQLRELIRESSNNVAVVSRATQLAQLTTQRSWPIKENVLRVLGQSNSSTAWHC